MKKILTLIAAVVCGLAMNAKTLYLNPGVWETDNPKFAMYYFNPGSDGVFSDYMTKTGNFYQGELPTDYSQVIFVRLNPEGAINWESKWNQTDDLVVPETENLYTISDWGGDKSPGAWSTYTEGGDNPGGGGEGGGTGVFSGKDFFLKGYCNDKDIETPTADEQFEGGILSYTFTGDNTNHKGYFFILVCEAGQVVGDCYMAAEYTDATHCTLVKQDGEHVQKLGVPEGTVTFYLYDNGDGTLELSTEELPGKTLVGGGTEAVENTTVSEKAHKVIINGQLRIVRGDKVFDVTGRQL